MSEFAKYMISNIAQIPDQLIFGSVLSVRGLIIEVIGLSPVVSIGSRCEIIKKDNVKIEAEIIGFHDKVSLLMPFGSMEGIGPNCKVLFKQDVSGAYPCESWKGRVIDASLNPIDGKGKLNCGDKFYHFKAPPILSHDRARVQGKVDLGVKTINSFLSCCYGQRMGIFAGSGVGKSVLISMLGRYALMDVKVIGLVGERGRELHEFIYEYLGEEGLKNCVIVVATGDEPAVVRRQAAYLTMAIAEFFRDLGQNVLCIIDSITRFAMAQREIGLSAGEPPSSKGYTPSVFSELPKLLERAGPGKKNSGSITGLFSVLVEGDDHNEPIADAVRGILDGHIVLDRAIAERGVFPAINVLRSISRTMPACNNEQENLLVTKARRIISNYTDMAEMIRLGAYKIGTDKQVDEAIKIYPLLENFMKQLPNQSVSMSESYEMLTKILANTS